MRAAFPPCTPHPHHGRYAFLVLAVPMYGHSPLYGLSQGASLSQYEAIVNPHEADILCAFLKLLRWVRAKHNELCEASGSYGKLVPACGLGGSRHAHASRVG